MNALEELTFDLNNPIFVQSANSGENQLHLRKLGMACISGTVSNFFSQLANRPAVANSLENFSFRAQSNDRFYENLSALQNVLTVKLCGDVTESLHHLNGSVETLTTIDIDLIDATINYALISGISQYRNLRKLNISIDFREESEFNLDTAFSSLNKLEELTDFSNRGSESAKNWPINLGSMQTIRLNYVDTFGSKY